MRKMLLCILSFLFIFFCAQAESLVYVGEKYSVADSPYTLVLLWPEGEEAPAHREVFQKLFFSGYPVMRELFGTSDVTEVSVFFHHAPDSVAYTNSQGIFVSIEYMAAHPEDHNLLIHELFHIVQNGYHGDDPFVPALTEGLADYARAKYSCLPDEKWALSSYQEGQSYMDSYGVTGGFLNWISQTYGEQVLIRLNRALHEGRYTTEVWKGYTGLTLDELWTAYSLAGV